jgi:hypothetical protein
MHVPPGLEVFKEMYTKYGRKIVLTKLGSYSTYEQAAGSLETFAYQFRSATTKICCDDRG